MLSTVPTHCECCAACLKRPCIHSHASCCHLIHNPVIASNLVLLLHQRAAVLSLQSSLSASCCWPSWGVCSTSSTKRANSVADLAKKTCEYEGQLMSEGEDVMCLYPLRKESAEIDSKYLLSGKEVLCPRKIRQGKVRYFTGHIYSLQSNVFSAFNPSWGTVGSHSAAPGDQLQILSQHLGQEYWLEIDLMYLFWWWGKLEHPEKTHTAVCT